MRKPRFKEREKINKIGCQNERTALFIFEFKFAYTIGYFLKMLSERIRMSTYWARW